MLHTIRAVAGEHCWVKATVRLTGAYMGGSV